MSLGQAYSNVSKIELWLDGGNYEGYYAGSGDNTYVIHITDIQFYTR